MFLLIHQGSYDVEQNAKPCRSSLPKLHGAQPPEPPRVSLIPFSINTMRHYNPSQILIPNTLPHTGGTLRLSWRSTLLQLIPKVMSLITSKQNRFPPVIAIDILGTVYRANPLACSTTVATSWRLKKEGLRGVRWILEGDGLGGWSWPWGPWKSSYRDGSCGDSCGDGCGDGVVCERDEKGGVEEAKDGEDDAGVEVFCVTLRHGDFRGVIGRGSFREDFRSGVSVTIVCPKDEELIV